MILIDKPFASDFLIKTIKENKYEVVSTDIARALLNDDDLSWVSEKEASRFMKENHETRLYTNSENALTWLDNHLGDSDFAVHAQLFKDKVRFRELIQSLYPGFYFRTVKLEEIQSLNKKELPFPFVIKPSVGFFSIGVHVVKTEADWEVARKELNYKNLESFYPRIVLDTTTFIIEEYIEGEEFAIDCYYNNEGEVVILNILHHKFSSGADTSDRVYSTSLDIVLQYKNSFEAFLQSIGQKAGIKNFPAHVELRVDAEGRINPIEIRKMDVKKYSVYGFVFAETSPENEGELNNILVSDLRKYIRLL